MLRPGIAATRPRRFQLGASPLVCVAISVGISGAISGLLFSPAAAERWMCPDCSEIVERVAGSPVLECPQCQQTHESDDLCPPVAYINSRTRDAEVAWVAQGENCSIFRLDGLQAFDPQSQEIWVPWVMVDWFLPRMRLLRLTDGQELATDYPKSREGGNCPVPPTFAFEVADSIEIPNRPTTARTLRMNDSVADLFLVAFTPEARDSARVRFIREVEEGKHPRLPRTAARLANLAPFRPRLQTAAVQAEALVEVRVNDRGGVIRLRKLLSSGHDDLDREALRVAETSGYYSGGELGVPVPSSLRLHFYFGADSARVQAEPVVPGVWDQ